MVASFGIERFDRAAKLGQIGADAGVLVDRLDRPVEKAVGRARGLGDLLAAHGGQLIDLLAEFGAVGIERGELIDELRNALVELGGFVRLERDEAGGFGRRDRLQRLGRVELELGRGLGGGLGGFGSHGSFLSLPFCGAAQGRSTARRTPHWSFSCIISVRHADARRGGG